MTITCRHERVPCTRRTVLFFFPSLSTLQVIALHLPEPTLQKSKPCILRLPGPLQHQEHRTLAGEPYKSVGALERSIGSAGNAVLSFIGGRLRGARAGERWRALPRGNVLFLGRHLPLSLLVVQLLDLQIVPTPNFTAMAF